MNQIFELSDRKLRIIVIYVLKDLMVNMNKIQKQIRDSAKKKWVPFFFDDVCACVDWDGAEIESVQQ